MSEVSYQDRHFEIRTATLDDVIGIGEAHLQAWIETYPNVEYGVDVDWIKNEFSFLVRDGQDNEGNDNGIPFRKKVIENLDENTLYEVVKDEEGIVQGFMHADRTDREVHLNAIYLTDTLKGAGVAHELMERTLEFAGNLPVVLQVIAYNERAIRFYEKYGFIRGETEEELFRGKMPVLNMKREVA
jgi:ribosomal protein S18 acetylase RimI-like enzyme